jgi:hypothetical protein
MGNGVNGSSESKFREHRRPIDEKGIGHIQFALVAGESQVNRRVFLSPPGWLVCQTKKLILLR